MEFGADPGIVAGDFGPDRLGWSAAALGSLGVVTFPVGSSGL